MSECRLGRYCDEHGFVHGAEAEELREKFSLLLLVGYPMADDDAETVERRFHDGIQRILGEVDARDSVAYVEVMKELEEEGPQDDHPPPRCQWCKSRGATVDIIVRDDRGHQNLFERLCPLCSELMLSTQRNCRRFVRMLEDPALKRHSL